MRFRLVAALVIFAQTIVFAGCGGAPAGMSTMLLQLRPRPLALHGADSAALPPADRARYAVVLGTLYAAGTRLPCIGEVWLRPRRESGSQLQAVGPGGNWGMFRFPRLAPGTYEIGARCLGYAPIHRSVRVRAGDVLRVLIDMQPVPGGEEDPPPRPIVRPQPALPPVVET